MGGACETGTAPYLDKHERLYLPERNSALKCSLVPDRPLSGSSVILGMYCQHSKDKISGGGIMPRLARIVGVGLPHHVTQRGNYRQNIFESDSDKERYLLWVAEYSRKAGLSVLAYCLMNNHVHFIAVPGKEYSMAHAFNNAHMRYSQYFNDKHKENGHLWQSRFFSCVLDGRHLLAAARYIERNPVRAGLVKTAEAWKWSSASAHCDGVGGAFDLDLGKLWDIIDVKQGEWKEFLKRDESYLEVSDIRGYTHTGRPLGNGRFIEKLEHELGRTLRASSVGRPKIIK